MTSVVTFYCHIKWGDNTWDLERIFRVITVSQNYPPENGQFLSNPSLWTIPLEIEFYALYPLALFLLVKFGFSKLLILSAIITGISHYLAKQGLHWISYHFLWPSWLLGCWVASLHRNNKLSELKLLHTCFPLILFLIFALSSRLQNWALWIQYASWTGFYFFSFYRDTS